MRRVFEKSDWIKQYEDIDYKTSGGESFREVGDGEHFAGKKHHDGGNDRTDRHGTHAPLLRYREGDDRSCGDMYDIGADKQGADGQIKIIQHIKSLFCPEVAAFGRRLNAAARCGGHRSLRNSKKCGAYKQQRGNYPRQSTAIIHKRIHISF